MTSIETINSIVGQETLHPLICVVDGDTKSTPVPNGVTNDLYALTISSHDGMSSFSLRIPGDNIGGEPEEGLYFHPDLLFGTPLEKDIYKYPTRCKCRGYLTDTEIGLIEECLGEIKTELYHPIDRHSAMILSSRIELLLNYCIRICD